MKVIIIGGVAGGMSAAARLRRLSETAEITVLEKGGYVSFANCGLPYYIGGEITDRQNLLLQTPESFRARFNVDVRVRNEAVSIDAKAKTIRVSDLDSGKEYDETYDKLLLSPGAEPVKPPIPGIDNKKIFTLRNMEDTDKIYEFINERQPGSAAVIGGGYIGLETAENLRRRGIDVVVIEAMEQVMGLIDKECASLVRLELMEKGISIHLGDGVKSFSDEAGKLKITTAGGKEITADMAIFSVGVKADIKLAKEAGLETARGIKVNEYMQTSDPDIYAVGDACEVKSAVTEKAVYIPLAGPANKQGRLVAENILSGNTVKYRGTIGSGVLKVFGLTVAATGLNSKQLAAEGVEFESVLLYPGDHAGYYPGAMPLMFKLLFDRKTGRIYGAQCIGASGAEKRIDVISAFMQKNGTVEDLMNFEHCYAPPFSSAKDPVNMAGFMAENIIKGRVKQITYEKISSLNSGWAVLDVRETEELMQGMLPGAMHVPLNMLRARTNELPRDKKILVYCAVGLRGYLACRILMNNGFTEVYNLSGGIRTISIINS